MLDGREQCGRIVAPRPRRRPTLEPGDRCKARNERGFGRDQPAEIVLVGGEAGGQIELEADGSERDTLDVFVRPYLRAVAGTDSAFAWDQKTATASWTGDGGVSEIALPTRRFDAASLDIELSTTAGPEGACWTLDPSRGELRVQAPDGAQVEVRVTVAD